MDNLFIYVDNLFIDKCMDNLSIESLVQNEEKDTLYLVRLLHDPFS